jgi:4'-phosphopantetheinyl transferase
MPFMVHPAQLPDVAIGLWKIEEEEDFFLDRLSLYAREWERFNAISHPQKRLEWLSSRLCLKELLKIDQPVESLNQLSGRPYLTDNSHHISYTHSSQYAAAIASSSSQVAIDIEARDRDRNLETRRLFMNAKEMAIFANHPDELLFLTLWSAKETLFKIVGKKGISLRQHIAVDIENFDGAPNGTLNGTVSKGKLEKQFEVHYAIRPDYVLTYTHDGMPAFGFWEEDFSFYSGA